MEMGTKGWNQNYGNFVPKNRITVSIKMKYNIFETWGDTMVKLVQVQNPAWTIKNVEHIEAHQQAYGDLGIDTTVLRELLNKGQAGPRINTSADVIAFEVQDDSTHAHLGDIVLIKGRNNSEPDAWEVDTAIFDDSPDKTGTQAMEQLLQVVPNLGISKMEGLVRTTNPNRSRIVNWLKRMGFVEKSEFSDYNVTSLWYSPQSEQA